MIKLSDKGVSQEMGRLSNEAGKLYSWKNKGLEIYKIVQMKYQEYKYQNSGSVLKDEF